MEAIRGRCRCCGKEFSKAGIVKHLSACSEKAGNQAPGGKETGCFELMITSRYRKEYWLVIEIEDTAKLSDLDRFLRNIWVECCGHLSAFTINGILYDSAPSGSELWGPKPRSMHIQLNKVLKPGETFLYEYDFGDTTELLISVKAHTRVPRKKQQITILSRNNPPVYKCSICRERNAVWLDPESEEEPVFLCEDCLTEQELDEEFLLPVCNSPRMGVCGYEGSRTDTE